MSSATSNKSQCQKFLQVRIKKCGPWKNKNLKNVDLIPQIIMVPKKFHTKCLHSLPGCINIFH